MIVLDTHVLVFDALDPGRLTPPAREAIQDASERGVLACADISLWEIAMLLARGRLAVAVEPGQFLSDLVLARGLRILPITPEIAVLAQSERFSHEDPADRLIAATALAHGARLVTADRQLLDVPDLPTVW